MTTTPNQPTNSPLRIRVMVVDDQALVRAGFAALLDSDPELTVVGQAADGRDAMDLAPAARPDVVLMDIRMPNMDGIEATRQLLDGPDPRAVLVLTTFDLDEYVYDTLQAGKSRVVCRTRRSPPNCSSARRPSRPTSDVCCPSSTCPVGPKRSRSPTRPLSSFPGGTEQDDLRHPDPGPQGTRRPGFRFGSRTPHRRPGDSRPATSPAMVTAPSTPTTI